MRRHRRGAAMVELAIAMPLLLLILMGIVEFGMVMHDQLMLAQGAREGARAAAIGKVRSEVVAETIRASLLAVKREAVEVELLHAEPDDWKPITDAPDGKENSVSRNTMVRVTIKQYHHRMVTGSFFAWLPGYKDGGLNLSAAMVMRRE